MRLTIFSRLVLGYLGILLLMMVLSVYAVYALHRFNTITRSVLETDNRVLDYEKKLADTLLSEIRYERKFFITGDFAMYDQFLLFKSDFEDYLDGATAVADAPTRALLSRVRASHQRYAAVVIEGSKVLKSARINARDSRGREKEQITDSIMTELERIRIRNQRSTYEKIERLAETAASARQIALVMTGFSLIFLLALSLFITRSITRPISALKMKTREIAEGRFEADVRLSSPPEIAELAVAFNAMSGKLRDLDRMKSDFFSSMSHELRTPLTSIKEGASLLLEGVGGAPTERQRKLLGILAEESQRLIALVNSLLDLSKMEAGMMVYHFEPTSIVPLIDKVTVELGPLVEAKKITMESAVGESLPEIHVDRERILQALRNLLGNAIKFAPEGGRVTVSATQSDGVVEVAVVDSGPGIPQEELATIFEKYQQATSGSYRIKGTGLGLALVKHIITSHGGRVWAESEPGQGSKFVFILPV